MLQIIETFAISHYYMVYLIIGLVALAEGPFLAVFCGALLAIGYLRFFPLLISIVIGNMVGDIVWYYIGYKIGHPFVLRFGRYVGLREPDIFTMENLFARYQYPILFVSKISNGFGLAIVVLFTAGLVRMPFAPFLWISLLGEILWSGSLIDVGYIFSTSLIHTQDTFHRAWIIMSLCAVICVFLL